MKNKLMQLVEEAGMRKDVADFAIGDTVDVHQRILEGQTERIQQGNGTTTTYGEMAARALDDSGVTGTDDGTR